MDPLDPLGNGLNYLHDIPRESPAGAERHFEAFALLCAAVIVLATVFLALR